jgi:hypothetical protein
MAVNLALVYGRERVAGAIEVRDGRLGPLRAAAPGGSDGARFALPAGGRLEIALAECRLGRGSKPTLIFVREDSEPFAFFARDVTARAPIWIPEFRVAVLPGDDARTYEQVAADLAGRGLISDFARFEAEPEWDYASAAALNRSERCPTWLGLGRDMRLFRLQLQELFPYWGVVQPFFHDRPQSLPGREFASAHYELAFVIGHGSSCRPRITRRLEDGVLPILRSLQAEPDVDYHLEAFASLEREPLRPGGVRGSDWRAVYPHTAGNMATPDDLAALDGLIKAETWGRDQEIVCCLRVRAVNTGRVPRYAWFKAPRPRPCRAAHENMRYPADRSVFEGGFCRFREAGSVYAVVRLDGAPAPDEELAVLVQPGEAAVWDLLIPHTPVSPDRARTLLAWDADAHREACRAFWQARLDSAGSMRVPEPPVDDSLRAGLLHADLVAEGLEPDGPVLPTIGGYAPIGSESAPIIQYFDCVGWHHLAERCLQFFFERQRPDGFIQNFARYESETGPLLWTAGEHFRYTRDRAWLQRVTPHLRRACDYLLAWRDRNKTEACRAAGCYGMVSGKVADPDDFFHSFFLNAGTYLGLARAEEMFRETAPDMAARLAAELPAYRADIRAGFEHAQARAPVIPLPDGSWAPLMPPWVEAAGATTLYADGGNWFSHGAFASRSNLTGPLWLIPAGVLDPDERATDFLLKTNQYPMTLDNAALSQPYYCRHDVAHLLRGEVAAYLRLYYNQLTALQDRETRTFWEHYFHAGQHKTHEEAWFLLQTRWMLYREDGPDLRLLSGIPRAWFEHGREIRIRGMKSYFGTLDLRARSDLDRGRITIEAAMTGPSLPRRLLVRVPHPRRLRAAACAGGAYEPARELATVEPFTGSARLVLTF